MLEFSSVRLTWIWLLLMAVTCLSWSAVQGVAWAGTRRVGGTLVIAIAFLKVRFVMLEFMEMRHAPVALRAAAEIWILLCCAGVLGLYLSAAQPAPS